MEHLGAEYDGQTEDAANHSVKNMQMPFKNKLEGYEFLDVQSCFLSFFRQATLAQNQYHDVNVHTLITQHPLNEIV
jgi:hypothetical protein